MSSLKKRDINAINQFGRMSRRELESVSSIPSINTQKTAEENVSTVIEAPIVEGPITTTAVEIISAQKNELINISKPEHHEESRYTEFIKNTKKNIVDVDIHLLDPAPSHWNIFPSLSETKITQLVFSIENSGLFDPVIVWEKENGRYMILSGHNRVLAFHKLLQEYSDETYTYIPAIVYPKHELTDEQAKEIIIDTNFIQRGDFTPRLRAKILQARQDIYKNQKDKKGRNIKEITKELGLKKSAVYEDFTIIEKSISFFQNLYYEGMISRKSILKITTLPSELQNIIAKDYTDKVTDRKIASIQKEMSEEDIRTLFESKNNFAMDKTVKVRIPSNHYDEFMAIYNEFIAKFSNEGLTKENE